MNDKDIITDGLKHDGGKPRLDLVPPEIIEAVGTVMTFGMQKYGESSYRQVDPRRYRAALMRHICRWLKKHHYSGKVVNNSCLHFGCFLDEKLHGVMSYGPSLDKSKMLGLVDGTGWNEFLELNRMAFDDYLPRNSESYCIAKSLKLIKKNAPQIKWVVSFADGCSCGDGTIYRASNFVLTDIKPNNNLVILPSGEKIHKMTLESHPTIPRKELGGKSYYDITGGKFDFKKYVEYVNGEILQGYQLRYVYFIDKSYQKKLTVPVIPFSKIDEIGAGMYRGEKITQKERHIMK